MNAGRLPTQGRRSGRLHLHYWTPPPKRPIRHILPRAPPPRRAAATAGARAEGGSSRMSAKIGILFGQERSFPEALARAIHDRARGRVQAEPAQVGAVRQAAMPAYDLVLDRISQDVPFYRTLLKALAA